jgi:hypothetical protein
MSGSVTAKEFFAQIKIMWKLHFMQRGIHGQQWAQVRSVPPV